MVTHVKYTQVAFFPEEDLIFYTHLTSGITVEQNG